MNLQRVLFFSLLATVTFGTMGACTDSNNNTGGSGGGGGGGNGGADTCGQAACSSLGEMCGSFVDGCGQTITCNICRYTSEKVADATPSNLALTTGPSVQLAYSTDITVVAGGTPWMLETVNSKSSVGVDLAQGPEGTSWLAFVMGNELFVARKVGGAWVTDSITNNALRAAIAVGNDGTPYVAWTNGSVNIAGFDGNTWTTKPVGKTAWLAVDIAVNGNEPQVIYGDSNTKTLIWAREVGGSFETEAVAADIQDPAGDLNVALAVDTTGRSHVAYTQYGAKANSVHYAVREGNLWNDDGIIGSAEGSADVVIRIAVNAKGEPVLGILGPKQTLSVGMRSGAHWLTQVVQYPCFNRPFDIGFDASDTLLVAHACNAEVALLQHAGVYPASYVTACAAISSTLCDSACTCGKDCCMHSGGSSFCSGPSDCVERATNMICGDATQDPALVETCSPDAKTGQCDMAIPSLTLPSSCAPLFF